MDINDLKIGSRGRIRTYKKPKETKENPESGHKNGHKDSDFDRVAAAWPKLAPALRTAILAIVDSAKIETGGVQ